MATSAAPTYTDYSHIEEESVPFTTLPETSSEQAGPNFAMRLHYMISDLENEGNLDFVAWQPHGRAFRVCNTQELAEKILPLWFRQNKYSSFQRQLNFYGFKRLTRGPDRGCYYHELFLRGKSFLAQHIRRVTIKGTGPRRPAEPEYEPDLYQYPSLPSLPTTGHLRQTAAATRQESTHHRPTHARQDVRTLESSLSLRPFLPPIFQSPSSPRLAAIGEPHVLSVAPTPVDPFSPSRSLRSSQVGEAKSPNTIHPSTSGASVSTSLLRALQDNASQGRPDLQQLQSHLRSPVPLLPFPSNMFSSLIPNAHSSMQARLPQQRLPAISQYLLPPPPFLDATPQRGDQPLQQNANTDLFNVVNETTMRDREPVSLQSQLLRLLPSLNQPGSQPLRDREVDWRIFGLSPPLSYHQHASHSDLTATSSELERNRLLSTQMSAGRSFDPSSMLVQPSATSAEQQETQVQVSEPATANNDHLIELLRTLSAQRQQDHRGLPPLDRYWGDGARR